MNTSSVDELKLDLDELRDLRGRSNRQRVRDFLDLQIRRLETDLLAAQEAAVVSGAGDGPKSKPSSEQSSSVFTVEIKTYAWDQSDKFFKLYISEGMTGVGALEPDRVKSEFTEHSVHLTVRGLNGRDRELRIARLYDRILPADSSIRVKRDQVVVMLRKAVCSTWVYVTEAERKAKEKQQQQPEKSSKKSPGASAGDEEDPSAGLMGLMRKMYEEGDDEMKRTIAKAWSESQNKRAAGE